MRTRAGVTSARSTGATGFADVARARFRGATGCAVVRSVGAGRLGGCGGGLTAHTGLLSAHGVDLSACADETSARDRGATGSAVVSSALDADQCALTDGLSPSVEEKRARVLDETACASHRSVWDDETSIPLGVTGACAVQRRGCADVMSAHELRTNACATFSSPWDDETSARPLDCNGFLDVTRGPIALLSAWVRRQRVFVVAARALLGRAKIRVRETSGRYSLAGLLSWPCTCVARRPASSSRLERNA
jgi:hypothetical protein